MAPIGSTIAVDPAVESRGRGAVFIDRYVEEQSDHQPGRYAVTIPGIHGGTP
ncbi:MAG: hypothetical protein V3R47_06855 [candidate division NC10 bacterium]